MTGPAYSGLDQLTRLVSNYCDTTTQDSDLAWPLDLDLSPFIPPAGIVAVRVPDRVLPSVLLTTLRSGVAPLLSVSDAPLEVFRQAEEHGVTAVLTEPKSSPPGWVAAGGFGSLGLHIREDSRAKAPQLPRAAGPLVGFRTSGSQGAPAAVWRPLSGLLAEGASVVRRLRVSAESTLTCCVPLAHVYGFSMGLTAALVSGAALRLRRPRRPSEVAGLVNSPGVVIAVPGQLRVWSSRGNETCEPSGDGGVEFVTAGAPLPGAVRSAFEAAWRVPVRHQYGMTECGAISVQDVDEEGRADGSVGRPYDGVRVTLASEVGAGAVPTDTKHAAGTEAAEVLVDSDFTGFREVVKYQHSGGWRGLTLPGVINSGDLGTWTPHSTLCLVGRRADVVKINGTRVDPREVEEIISQLDHVLDAAVLPVSSGDGGDALVGFLVVDPYYTQSDFMAAMRGQLSSSKHPGRLILVEQIPRGVLGKPLRDDLFALLATDGA